MCFSVFVIIQFLNLVLISFWLKFLFCDFRIVTNRCFRLLIVTSLIFQLSWVIRLCRSISINNKMCPNIFGDLFVSSLQFVFAFMTNNSSLQFELNNKQQFEFCFTFLHVFFFVCLFRIYCDEICNCVGWIAILTVAFSYLCNCEKIECCTHFVGMFVWLRMRIHKSICIS